MVLVLEQNYSTLLKEKPEDEGYFTMTLDLGFGESDRAGNIRRAAEIAEGMLKNNIINICSFVTPL
ncbi:adenylylsulfate kinase-like enzyme [Pedobacter sp. AK013]|uniref:adenylyl-sulfate kinase n=1 Tax=Pedobacter sp. AK013 TaxID=2723071 RepID=UPI001621B412|nr:adenylyl-sulfate kinase [Pedobacter sp. AK013]MBB6236180.1 adenylylsulfate kinase-like enzyme [Pedobacter sp. AK013]